MFGNNITTTEPYGNLSDFSGKLDWKNDSVIKTFLQNTGVSVFRKCAPAVTHLHIICQN